MGKGNKMRADLLIELIYMDHDLTCKKVMHKYVNNHI